MAKSIKISEIKTIIFVCEAGIGSSLMSVNALKKKFRKAGVEGVTIKHSATTALEKDIEFIMCHNGIIDSVRDRVPDAVIVGFNLFFNDPVFDEVLKAFQEDGELTSTI